MAELVLNINSPTYEDGDIIHALNDEKILWTNAENIFWERVNNSPSLPKVSGFVGNKFPLLFSCLDQIYRYKFERVSLNEVIRRDKLTGEIIVGSPYSYTSEWQIDVYKHVLNLKYSGGILFGKDGREVWFGGPIDKSSFILNKVWNLIEQHTSHIRENNKKWNATQTELTNFFFISAENFNNETSQKLMSDDLSIEVDDDKKLLLNVKPSLNKKRLYYVDWKNFTKMSFKTKNAVTNKDKQVDLRDKVIFKLEDIIQYKKSK